MKKRIILVVDYGTSNVRVNAIDTDNGEIVHSASKKYLIESAGNGYAEISVDQLWKYSEYCMAKVVESLEEKEEPKAIAFSFFGDNLIPVDSKGRALNDCILCTDARGEEEVEYINSKIPEEEQIQIIGDSYMLYKVGTKILWVKNHMREIADKVAFYDSQQQYIFRRLGVHPVNDYTMAARKQLCNINNLTWSKRFLDVLGITEESLGTIIMPSDAIAGYVDSYGSVKFRQPLPVIAGGHDCDMGLIGMGVINESLDFIGDITGTFDHVGYLSNGIVNLAEKDRDCPLRSYHGPLQDTSVCLGAIPTAGATLEWYMREIHGAADQSSYQEYWNQIQFDGKGSVMVYPTLDGNRGKIEGIGVTTSKQDIFKAVIEAVSYTHLTLPTT